MGQTTFLSSDMVSPKNLNLEPLEFFSEACCLTAMFSPTSYFVSRCKVCTRHRGQYLFSSNLPGSFFLFLSEVYVLSLHWVQARWIVIRASPFFAIAYYSFIPVTNPDPTVLPPSLIANRCPCSRATGT